MNDKPRHHDFERIVNARATLIAAQLGRCELLQAVLPSMPEAGPEPPQPHYVAPQGSERPTRFFARQELPPDGPAQPQRGKSLWRRFAYLERKGAMADRTAARLAPPRPRPAFDCLTVADLTDDTCRYPHAGETFRFCGRAPQRGPYCADHAELCFL